MIEMRDGFITNVLSNAEVQETITRRREILVNLGQTLQLFVIIVGSSLKEKNNLLVVYNTFYCLQSIISAVDYCFKLIIYFNAEYPSECEGIWYFIQFKYTS